jgi:membrane-bound lytic murein transglycosylase B
LACPASGRIASLSIRNSGRIGDGNDRPDSPDRCDRAAACGVSGIVGRGRLPKIRWSFDDCLVELRQAALDEGIPGALTDEVLGNLEFQPRVIELDRAQPEFHQTLAAYLRSRVTPARIERGRILMEQHRDLLMRLHRDYGIPGQYLVALWGMESDFGRNTGNMPTLDSLATLACDPRRSTFFRTELLFALRLIEREQLQPEAMRGSWAGAMGQTQFMPSAYFKHAVDGDGDGRIDLWNNPADALASGARLLQSLGWQTWSALGSGGQAAGRLRV